jgi:hypothetical protein
MMSRPWVIGAAVWCCIAAAQPLSADPPPAGPAGSPPEPILYSQRWMSEELIAELGAGFLPMHRAKFQAAIDERQRRAARQGAARIEQAYYAARWVGPGELEGEAQLTITHQGDSPAALAMVPCRVAIGKPRWRDDPVRPASAGADPHGHLVAVVDRGGIIEFPWSLRGERSVVGEYEFNLGLPAGARNRLRLDLPPQYVPLAPQAVVQPLSGNRRLAAGIRGAS